MAVKIGRYQDFWPYYLKEHSNPRCRQLHYAGTTIGLVFLVFSLVTQNPHLIPVILIAGYGPAWAGHFFIEKNRPATFQYPLWSLVSDIRMYFMWLSRNLDKELDHIEV